MKASSILVCPVIALRQLPPAEVERGKFCTRCGEFALLTEFNIKPRGKDGVTSRCKACIRVLGQEARARYATDERRVISETKYCSHCEQTKLTAEFYSMPKSKSGLSNRCRTCVKQQSGVRYEENRDLYREKAKEWRAANPDRKRANDASWIERNQERKRANDARYYRKNKHRWRVYSENRRARERASPGIVSINIVQRLLRLQRGKCACCKKPLGSNYHLDHVLPLILGGRHDDLNLQLLHARCNLQKNRKHPVQFMQERGFLL
jgi:hypothetical protein